MVGVRVGTRRGVEVSSGPAVDVVVATGIGVTGPQEAAMRTTRNKTRQDFSVCFIVASSTRFL